MSQRILSQLDIVWSNSERVWCVLAHVRASLNCYSRQIVTAFPIYRGNDDIIIYKIYKNIIIYKIYKLYTAPYITSTKVTLRRLTINNAYETNC